MYIKVIRALQTSRQFSTRAMHSFETRSQSGFCFIPILEYRKRNFPTQYRELFIYVYLIAIRVSTKLYLIQMALPTTYTQEFKRLDEFFSKIRDAQAPDKFTNQLLVDWGYKSNNHRPFIPILKALGFLTADGTPTQRYKEYRNHSASKSIMGDAIKEAYSDIFLIKEKPTASDKSLIEGKFKSYHNASDTVAGLMTKTFFALLDLADLNTPVASPFKKPKDKLEEEHHEKSEIIAASVKQHSNFGLHYNIQIHLPATKDVEVYNAIFKSLKDHLIG
jgi:hypothetical protein